jgi:hypothetical protein
VAVLGADRLWAGTIPVPDDLLDTALACASVLVADDATTGERALGWGCPVVCDVSTAQALGLAADGTDATDGLGRTIVAVGADPQALARDTDRLAALSWRGRRWWEDRHDAAGSAAQLALDLLPATAASPALRLAELRTPPGAVIRDRLRDFLTERIS